MRCCVVGGLFYGRLPATGLNFHWIAEESLPLRSKSLPRNWKVSAHIFAPKLRCFTCHCGIAGKLLERLGGYFQVPGVREKFNPGYNRNSLFLVYWKSGVEGEGEDQRRNSKAEADWGVVPQHAEASRPSPRSQLRVGWRKCLTYPASALPWLEWD